MSNPEFAKIHEALQTISDRVASGHAPRQGICGAVADVIEREMHLDSDAAFEHIYLWMEDWPKRSKNYRFPVPSPNDWTCPIKAFYQAFDGHKMWDGEYGDNRKELLAYLLKRAHFAAYVN